MKAFYFLVLSVAFLSSSLFGAETPDSLVLKGRVFLSGMNLPGANSSFAQALSMDPTHHSANALYAFTRLTVLPLAPAGSNFLNRLGMPSAGRDLYHWTSSPPRDVFSNLVPRNDLDLAEATHFLRTHVLAAVVAAGQNLANITNRSFLLHLSSAETRAGPVSVDYGDILLSRAGLHVCEFIIYSTYSWNLSSRLADLYHLQTNDLFSIERFLRDHPSFLTYSNTNDLAAAKAAFQNFVARYVEASDFIRARHAEQIRFFTWDQEKAEAESQFRRGLLDVNASLGGPVVPSFGTNYTINFGRYFAGVTPPHSWLPRFRGNDILATTWPDVTFGGLVAGLTLPGVDLLVSRQVEILTGFFAVQKTLNGLLSLDFSTITGRVYSLQYSTDFTSWHNLIEFYADGGRLSWVDSPAENAPHRFYRLKDLTAANQVLTGLVVDGCSRSPINGASVTVESRSATTGPDGRFQLITQTPLDDRPHPPFQATISAPGYQTSTSQFYDNDRRIMLWPSTYPSPPNDQFNNRTVVRGANAILEGKTCGATLEPGEPIAHFFSTTGSVWYSWTAPFSGEVMLRPLGDYDWIECAVFIGQTMENLRWVAQGFHLPFMARAGTTYQIVLARHNESPGPYSLVLAAPPYLHVFEPEAWSVHSGSIFFDLDAYDPDGRIARVEIEANGDVIAVLTNNSLTFEWESAPPGSYWVTFIAYDDFGNTSRDSRFITVRPANDDFADRIILSGWEAYIYWSNVGASSERGEPRHGGEPARASVWWTWAAPSSGPVTFEALPASDSQWGHVIAVYTSSLSGLSLHTNNISNPLNYSAQVTFNAVGGETYHIAVDSEDTSTFILQMTQGSPPRVTINSPANDSIFTVGDPITLAVSATDPDGTVSRVELYEPYHELSDLRDTSDYSVAYSSATLLASRTDSPYSITISNLNVGFYRLWALAIDNTALYGVSPRIEFRVGPVNDNFARAIPLFGHSVLVDGSNLAASLENGEPQHGPHVGGRSVWWSWTPSVDGMARIQASIDFYATSIAVYTGSQLNNLNPIANETQFGPAQTEFPVTGGEIYWIAVDGPYGNMGNILLELELTQTVPLSQALDTPGRIWATGGDALWFGQTSISFDRVDAAESGATSNLGQSWVETTLSGPGTLSFRWKVSSETSYDYLAVSLDNALQFQISGEVNWQPRTLNIPSGSHTVRFRYSKDSSVSLGSDCGWVDAVSFAQ